MDDKIKIIAAIVEAITEVNQTLPGDRKMSTDSEAPLYGPGGVVDSLTLTLLIVAIEQKIEQSLQKTITLVDYSINLGENNPFRSINALSEHIATLISQRSYAA